MNQDNVIKVEVTPEIVTLSLPANFLDSDKPSGQGFSDKTLAIPGPTDSDSPVNIIYEISYDGESELLGIVKSKPEYVSDENAAELLRGFFSRPENEEENEEEKEEVSA